MGEEQNTALVSATKLMRTILEMENAMSYQLWSRAASHMGLAVLACLAIPFAHADAPTRITRLELSPYTGDAIKVSFTPSILLRPHAGTPQLIPLDEWESALIPRNTQGVRLHIRKIEQMASDALIVTFSSELPADEYTVSLPSSAEPFKLGGREYMAPDGLHAVYTVPQGTILPGVAAAHDSGKQQTTLSWTGQPPPELTVPRASCQTNGAKALIYDKGNKNPNRVSFEHQWQHSHLLPDTRPNGLDRVNIQYRALGFEADDAGGRRRIYLGQHFRPRPGMLGTRARSLAIPGAVWDFGLNVQYIRNPATGEASGLGYDVMATADWSHEICAKVSLDVTGFAGYEKQLHQYQGIRTKLYYAPLAQDDARIFFKYSRGHKPGEATRTCDWAVGIEMGGKDVLSTD